MILIIFIILILLLYYWNTIREHFELEKPIVPIQSWKDDTMIYYQAFLKWVEEQQLRVKERRTYVSAPNQKPWAEPVRYPHGTIERTLLEDVNQIAKLYWEQATKPETMDQWSPYIRQFTWLKAESVWIADTNPVSVWKCYGIEGFILDQMHYVSYRVWLVVWVRWEENLYGEPETNIPGTYWIGYPTPGQAQRRINLPSPMEVIPTGRDILVSRPPVEAIPQEIRLWGLWVLPSTTTLAIHPIYAKDGEPYKIQYPWPSAGWADSSLESSTPSREVLMNSTPWVEPAVIANQWILPEQIPQQPPIQAFPCGKIPAWNWDNLGISPEVAPKELSCPWQTYALRPIPLRPSDTPTKATLPRDEGSYSWLFDATRGITQFPHANGK